MVMCPSFAAHCRSISSTIDCTAKRTQRRLPRVVFSSARATSMAGKLQGHMERAATRKTLSYLRTLNMSEIASPTRTCQKRPPCVSPIRGSHRVSVQSYMDTDKLQCRRCHREWFLLLRSRYFLTTHLTNTICAISSRQTLQLILSSCTGSQQSFF